MERADLAKAAAEEELLMALTRESSADVEKSKQAMYGSMLNAASAGLNLRAQGQKEAQLAGQAKANEEFNKMFQTYATSENADPAMTMLLMQAYGIGTPMATTPATITTPPTTGTPAGK